jgi:hypothetical protein
MRHIGKGLHYNPSSDEDVTYILNYFLPEDGITDYGQLGRLLYGYRLAGGAIAGDQHWFDLALSHLNKALILAREIHSPRLEAAALYRRGNVFFAQGKLAEARTFSVQDKADMAKKVLNPIKQASHLLGTDNQDEDLHFIRFTDQWYHLDSTSALLGSPIERFRQLCRDLEATPYGKSRWHGCACNWQLSEHNIARFQRSE